MSGSVIPTNERRWWLPPASRQSSTQSGWSCSAVSTEPGATICRAVRMSARVFTSSDSAVAIRSQAFSSEAISGFAGLDDAVDEAVMAALAQVRLAGNTLDLTATGLKAPSSTWTYLVNDDPFEGRIGALLTGPGGVTVAMYSAVMLMPLLIAWGLVERLLRRNAPRRSGPGD